MANLIQWAKQTLIPGRRASRPSSFSELFGRFQKILELNNQILDLVAEMGEKLSGDYVFDSQYIRSASQQVTDLASKLVYNLNIIAPKKYLALYDVLRRLSSEIEDELEGKLVIPQTDCVLPYERINRDLADIVGAKNANIGEVKNVLKLPTPEGFAITIRAFQSFMSHNQLLEKIDEAISSWKKGEQETHKVSLKIQTMILGGVIPPSLRKDIRNSVETLASKRQSKDLFLAVRSSAWGEDMEHSFAGQYLTLLNEPPGNLLKSYKAILASAYSESPMEYRRQKGFEEHEVAMSVACQTMIDSKVSGVLYTLDPRFPERDVMVISATWGLGAPVVAGEVRADHFTVARESAHHLVSLNIIRKARSLFPKKDGGTEFRPNPEPIQTQPSLTQEQITRLAEVGLMLERYFKKPQDIEFSIDHRGRLFVLQTRPLNIKGQVAGMLRDISSALKQYPVIFAGKGVIVQNGIGAGQVYLVRGEEDLNNFPHGAILVTRYTSPRFAKVIRKASGVLTDIGSSTGHMATIAREFRVPTIVDAGVATQVLKPGQEITVDAEDNVVYEGIVKELCYQKFTEEAFEESYEYRLLRRILKKISPLNLLDPHDKNFVSAGCKTFHDITRFAHEKAVEELISLNYYDIRDSHSATRKLKLSIPLDLVIIDIGGGLSPDASSPTVEADQVTSAPMGAFLEGLKKPGMWSSEPVSVDFGSFMSSLTRTFSSPLASPKYIGQNLAVISKEYANINLRLGYHFNLIDCYTTNNPNDNYAYFRFLGGVTEINRRSRRARFLGEILAKNDFRVDLRGDLIVARIKKLSLGKMLEKIQLLGQLVAFTRQLDVKMVSDGRISEFLEHFDQMVERNQNIDSVKEG